VPLTYPPSFGGNGWYFFSVLNTKLVRNINLLEKRWWVRFYRSTIMQNPLDYILGYIINTQSFQQLWEISVSALNTTWHIALERKSHSYFLQHNVEF